MKNKAYFSGLVCALSEVKGIRGYMSKKTAVLAGILFIAVIFFAQGCQSSTDGQPDEQSAGIESAREENTLAETEQSHSDAAQPGEAESAGEISETDRAQMENQTAESSNAESQSSAASETAAQTAGRGSDISAGRDSGTLAGRDNGTLAGQDNGTSAGQGNGTSAGQGNGTSAGQGDTTSACSSATGALHVEGTQLVGGNGEAVQLRGISTHGLAWFPAYVNEDCFRELREKWQANVVRLALYTAEYGGYCNGGNQEDLKQLIADGVEYAARADLYVIIDWHILSDSNPNTHREEAREFFAEMSARYAKETHVLYEICNEPNGGTSWSEIKAYAEEIIGVIRENDEDAVILVGTPNWSQYVDQAVADPITGYENLMYTLHFYAATHKEDLRSRMREAVEAGLPVFVSEYGICDASGGGAIDEEQANRWAEEMDRLGISYVAWNLSNKNETCAVLKSSCEKVSGFAEEDLSASGLWLYRRLTGNVGGLSDSEDGNTGSPEGSSERGSSGSGSSGAPETAPPASENPAPPETPVPAGNSQAAETPSANITLTNGGMEISAALINSWEADGQPVYQYSLTLRNASESRCTSWAVDVAFTGNIALMDGWNGDYSVDGSVLHIASKDYNGALEAGVSASDIGFIVSGGTITE